MSEAMESTAGLAVVTVPFITKLVDMFQSDDPRERKCLKTILHCVYEKVISLLVHIRHAKVSLFHRVVYENELIHGLSELLGILRSIIHSFTILLRGEHIYLLKTGLLPLHLPAMLPLYCVHLSFCVGQYAGIKAELRKDILRSKLRH